MLPITFLINEAARVRICFVLCGLTFLGFFLSILYLLAILILSSSASAYTSLVEAYNGDYIMTVLKWLASFAIVFNFFGCYTCYMAMYTERRAQAQMRMLMMTLAQMCLVIAFLWCSVLCYIYANHVDDSFKVSSVPATVESLILLIAHIIMSVMGNCNFCN